MARKSTADLRAAAMKNTSTAAAGVQASHDQTEQIRAAARDRYAFLSIETIHPDPDQPRRLFQPDKLDELKRAILALGGLENPLQIYHREGTGWTLKHGERRHRALSELVREGHDQFRTAPVLIDRAPEASAEGRRRFRIAQVVENNARENLLPLETAEQYYLIASTDLDGPMPATQLAALTGTDERMAQRYLFVVGGLTTGEREMLHARYPDAPLKPLYALVQWLQAYDGALAPASRLAAVERFAEVRPTQTMLRVALRDLAPRKTPGPRPRKRFSAGTTRTGAYQVKLTLPADLLRDPAAVRKAKEDLQRAHQQLDEIERDLRTGTGAKQ
ncbi:hypothetical protein BH23GEM5_BH23GEM5_04190 [soil metagenome]